EAWRPYNPFLSDRFKLPAQVVITSADGKTRYELLQTAEGPGKKSDFRCWPALGGRTIGRELIIEVAKANARPQVDARKRSIELPPGHYSVQAIYNHWLIAHWINAPNSAEPRPADGTADEPRPHRGGP